MRHSVLFICNVEKKDMEGKRYILEAQELSFKLRKKKT